MPKRYKKVGTLFGRSILLPEKGYEVLVQRMRDLPGDSALEKGPGYISLDIQDRGSTGFIIRGISKHLGG